MKKLLFAWLALLLGGFAPAQDRDPLKIESVMIGFPASGRLKNAVGNDSFNKDGCWTPVYITIRCAKPFPAPGYIVVSSADCDEVPTRYRVALPPMQPGQTEKIIGYTRPGGRRDSIRVAVYCSNDREISPESIAVNKGIEVSQFLYLGIGSPLDFALLPGLPPTEGESTVARSLDSRSLLASVTRVEDLPQQWFAYNSVDTVFISTADRDFATALVSERDGRKASLTEWVRRGGNLVVSVGRNQDLLAGAGELSDALPVRLTGTADVEIPRIAWTDGIASDEPLGKVTCANVEMRTDRNPHSLLSMKDRPLVVRSAFGLGRVTVVAFDVDGKPLDRWKGRETFWRELTNRSGTRVPTAVSDQPGAFGRYGDTVPEDGDFATLIRSMENFPGVPVISFGWVALFILGYILLVGPIDYLFLKKVVKRLEFTWITFPIIVFTVSGIAYYAAYALKGGDLRINKYDLVEIDVRNRLVQGRTWFTIFSPRIQNYRIGVEPAWGTASDGPDTTVGWAGQSRNSRQSLFPRSYDYLPKAAGLDSVPVQVWSTKGFQSEWVGSFDPKLPLAGSTLQVTPGGRGLTGEIKLNLPGPLENAYLIYGGGLREPTVRSLGTIRSGEPKTVNAGSERPFKNWIVDPYARERDLTAENAETVRTPPPEWLPLNLFFFEMSHAASDRPTNASLRSLDQSWRVGSDNANEAILIGTLAKSDGPAEAINGQATNPARLWLGQFPGGSAPRPALPGTLRQETCVRIFLPVRPAIDAPRN